MVDQLPITQTHNRNVREHGLEQHGPAGAAAYLGDVPDASTEDLFLPASLRLPATGGAIPKCPTTTETKAKLLITGTDGGQRSDLAMVVSLQSLLAQFSHPQVRGDFLNCKFGSNINPILLTQLDMIRWTVCPRWLRGDFAAADKRSRIAANHIQKLLSRSSEVWYLTDDKNASMTYSEWFATLEIIAADRYWDKVPYEQRCIHILSPSGINKLIEPRTRIENGNLSHASESTLRTRSRKKADTLSVSSTDSYDSSDSASPVLSSSENSDSSSADNKTHRRSRSSRRKYVKPAVFNMDGQTNLSEFFTSFERYFNSTYQGSSQDKTHVLSQFLWRFAESLQCSWR